MPSLEHRRFRPGLRTPLPAGLFARIGGQATVDRLVDGLYDRFAADAALRPLFARDTTRERANQKRFFAEWLGGPARYSETAWAGLHHRHDDLPITRGLAGRWLGHFGRALDAAGVSGVERQAVFARAEAVAFALVNGEAGHGKHRSAEAAACGVGARTVARAVDLARRGDVTGVAAAVDETPELLARATFAAAILHAAVWAGRGDVVTQLLERGVDVDKPHWIVAGAAFERVLFVTPWCAARVRRHAQVAEVLAARGAVDDVFSAAFLGAPVDPRAAATTDPAVDVLDLTPVHHAIAGGQLEALRTLLSANGPVVGGVRALRGAVERGDLGMVALLLARDGVDAARIGAGRWVLDPPLAAQLAAAGATVAGGAWISTSCTGNQGRKDDPDYVSALLAHGARVDARREIDGATALHCAARAGFLRTIAVLRAAGADVHARDAAGLTPREWVEGAAKSVDRAAVRRSL